MEIVVGVFAGLLTTAIVSTISAVARRRRVRRALAFLVSAAGSRPVQILLPEFGVKRFTPIGSTQQASIPGNVKVLPLAEGTAVATLVAALHRAGIRNVEISDASSGAISSSGLTILIGGPSVNILTRGYLAASFPEFSIRYPQHIVSYGSTKFQPELRGGELTEDFGFIAIRRTAAGSVVIALLGVWALGTQIATDVLIDAARHPTLAIGLRTFRERVFAVSTASVMGLKLDEETVIEVRHS